MLERTLYLVRLIFSDGSGTSAKVVALFSSGKILGRSPNIYGCNDPRRRGDAWFPRERWMGAECEAAGRYDRHRGSNSLLHVFLDSGGKKDVCVLYLQVDDPENCPAAVSSEKKQDLLHMEFYHHLPSWAMNEQMSYFSSFSDEWSRDLKSVQVQKQRSCRSRDLDESPDPSMSKIVLRNLIISSKYYKEEEAKELLEVITAERLETEQQQKLEQQEQLSIEKLRLEIELSRNANQSATQNNGQTSSVRSLDEIVKMVRLLTVKVPNKSDWWDYFFSSLENAFAIEMVSDKLKPKVLLCMLGDKVSNLLVNLGEEELKNYESLKQVVLKEYEPSPQKYA
ncbi:retrovirus-related Pol polyprotein from transposon opus [Trichonephila clavipes]|uniref:Retrovirus-related Pol polyprotein from transposon opus n=1 Tax=Trichonephila clavipes TaxID=2585209 RepID=A0A8X6W6U3_TRICX|nr:retrovirus-related Pol polyprotein from transposon opus [Trichonephila clavipes]